MTTGLILIQGQDLNKDSLRSISLRNAKQLLVGVAPEIGVVLHLAATSPADFGSALLKFAEVAGVTGVVTLMLRNSQ